MLYMDARSREGTITLHNAGPAPENVEVGFAFGYPTSDSAGNVMVHLTDTPPPGEPSAAGWLRAFPRRLTLQPGESQVVRILARPPEGLEDGEYWARVLVTSAPRPVAPEDGSVRGTSMQLRIATRIVTGLNFRKGTLSTGVRVAGAAVRADPSGLALLLDLERRGGAAFLGRVRVQAVDADGKVLASASEPVGVYRTLRKRVRLTLPPESRRRASAIRYTVEAEREDLPRGTALPSAAISGQAAVTGAAGGAP